MNTTHAIESAADATAAAEANTLLAPRFYRTDSAAINRLDLTSVEAEFEQMLAEFRSDSNRNHFERDAAFAAEIRELPPALRQEFLDFLISSVTAEFSGCVLYSDLRRELKHPALKELMGLMARDESRHAGFINKSLKDYGLQVDLGKLTHTKKYTYFRPKFIFYATYLSEKIGYARYITIFRQLQRHPEKRFHPIFRWFERWCNDEYRHGDAFALIMRSQPQLLRGHNRLWIRFFLLAVYATMYVRDHARPQLHQAFGFDPTGYDYTVFRITSECTRQVFPFTLDVDNPRFVRGLERLAADMQGITAARARGGLLAPLRVAALGLRVGCTFLRLYTLPVIRNELPAQLRMTPAW
jgi:magnesium-protoporphyrin IX monomethyl ester (oxidative) cyclase